MRSTISTERAAITDAAFELPVSLIRTLGEIAELNGWSLAYTLHVACQDLADRLS